MFCFGYIIGIGPYEAYERVRYVLSKLSGKINFSSAEIERVNFSSKNIEEMETFLTNFPNSWKLPKVIIDLNTIYLGQKNIGEVEKKLM